MKAYTRYSEPVLQFQRLEWDSPLRANSLPDLIRTGKAVATTQKPKPTGFSERLKASFHWLSHLGSKPGKPYRQLAFNLDRLHRHDDLWPLAEREIKEVNETVASLNQQEIADLLNVLDAPQLKTLIRRVDSGLLEKHITPNIACLGQLDHLSAAFVALEDRVEDLPAEFRNKTLTYIRSYREFFGTGALEALVEAPQRENLSLYLPLLTPADLEVFTREVLPQMNLPKDLHQIYHCLSRQQKEGLLQHLQNYDLNDNTALLELLNTHPLSLAIAVRSDKAFEKQLIQLLLKEIGDQAHRTLTPQALWAALLCVDPHDFFIKHQEDRAFLYEYVDFVLILHKENPHFEELLAPSLIKSVQEYELCQGTQHLRNRVCALAEAIYKIHPLSPEDYLDRCRSGVKALQAEIQRCMNILDNDHSISSQLAHDLIHDHDWIALERAEEDDIQVDHLATLATPLLRDLYDDLKKRHPHNKIICFWHEQLSDACTTGRTQCSHFLKTLKHLEALQTCLQSGDFVGAATIFDQDPFLKGQSHPKL